MRFTKTLLSLALLAATMTLIANAQDAKAKFTLPHDTFLGETILPAGQYTVTLALDGLAKAMVVSETGTTRSMFVLPVSTDAYAACEKSTVTIARSAGQWNVQSICFAGSQVAVYFPAPAEKTAIAKAAPAPTNPAGSK